MKRTHLWYNEADNEYHASHSGFARDQGSDWKDVTRDRWHSTRGVFFGQWVGSIPTPDELRSKGTEHGEQAALFCWAAACANAYESMACLKWMFAVPNGGARDRVTASMMKGEGVKPGVPDVMLPVTNPEYAGLWIELKRVKGGILSDDQKAYAEWLISQRYQWVRANGYTEARQAVLDYLRITL
ncbi:hypothetical protein Axy20_028 [Achromobacter phage vB_AxyS_19-32_Axy20]|nr:hypothetical protein Axy20_028 [Achromobacter phage vB_AxyS_19-32_Axy20]